MKSIKQIAKGILTALFGAKAEDTPSYLSMRLLQLDENPTAEFVSEINDLKAKRPDLHGDFAGRVLEDGRTVIVRRNSCRPSDVLRITIGDPEGDATTRIYSNKMQRVVGRDASKGSVAPLDKIASTAAMACMEELGYQATDFCMERTGEDLAVSLISAARDSSRQGGSPLGTPVATPK